MNEMRGDTWLLITYGYMASNNLWLFFLNTRYRCLIMDDYDSIAMIACILIEISHFQRYFIFCMSDHLNTFTSLFGNLSIQLYMLIYPSDQQTVAKPFGQFLILYGSNVYILSNQRWKNTCCMNCVFQLSSQLVIHQYLFFFLKKNLVHFDLNVFILAVSYISSIGLVED